MPDLKGIGAGLAAAFFRSALVHAARGVRVDAVGRSEGDINVAAVGLPAGLAGGVVLVAIGVLRRIGIGIAARPELLEEGVALFVVAEREKRLALLVGDDIGNLLVQPGLVGSLQLLPQGLLRLVALLVGALALEGIEIRVLILIFRGGLRLLLTGRRLLLTTKHDRRRRKQTARQRGYEQTTAIQHHCLKTPAILYSTGPDVVEQGFPAAAERCLDAPATPKVSGPKPVRM